MNANIKPLAHESKRPVSVEREHPDRIIIEGVRFSGDYFRELALPDTDVLYSIRNHGDVVTLVQIRSVEEAEAFFEEVHDGI